MSRLIIKLRNEEKLLINGAVIQNCGSKASLKICTENTKILRLREALHPDDATTPVKRAYYLAQLGASGTAPDDELQPQLHTALLQLIHAFEMFPQVKELREAVELATRCKYYPVMRMLSKFIPLEQQLLDRDHHKQQCALNNVFTAA